MMKLSTSLMSCDPRLLCFVIEVSAVVARLVSMVRRLMTVEDPVIDLVHRTMSLVDERTHLAVEITQLHHRVTNHLIEELGFQTHVLSPRACSLGFNACSVSFNAFSLGRRTLAL
jgi:hypothetical protein